MTPASWPWRSVRTAIRSFRGGIDGTARVWNAAPLAPNLIALHDARHQRKIDTLRTIQTATDTARRANSSPGLAAGELAAQAYASAVEEARNDLWLRFRYIDALIKSEKNLLIRPACDDLKTTFGNVDRPLARMAVLAFCRLAPQAIDHPTLRGIVHELTIARGEYEQAIILAKHGDWDLVAQGLSGSIDTMPDQVDRRAGISSALASGRSSGLSSCHR